MSTHAKYVLSFVVPLHNEEESLTRFHALLMTQCEKVGLSYEILYVDDGSTDKTVKLLQKICDGKQVKCVILSRNFGKEYALSAGIAAAKGSAILMLDGDGQHPIRLIPRFISAWRKGARTVVGVRLSSKSDSLVKRLGSVLFYKLFNAFSSQQLTPGSSDFRLIDRIVADEFLRLQEHGRMTRGLIDWVGFERAYIEFKADNRIAGTATYTTKKLMELAVQTITSLSFKPLFIFGWIGSGLTLVAFLAGFAVIVEQFIFNDPLLWNITGTAMLGILLLFSVGIMLMAIGVLSVYVASIQTDIRHRPLYIVDKERSKGL